MKIGKKLLMIGLSALMMVTPCFAARKVVSINGQQTILDIIEIEGRKYIESYEIKELSEQGYECSNYYESDNIVIAKNNKTLTLSKAKGEIREKTESMAYYDDSVNTYIPLETVVQYFGDTIEYPIPSEIKENFLNQLDTIGDIGYFERTMPYNRDIATVISYNLWESTMNNLYFILLEKLPNNKKKEFEQEQKEWEINRDKKIEEVSHSQCNHSEGECYAESSRMGEGKFMERYSLIVDRCYELLIRLP